MLLRAVVEIIGLSVAGAFVVYGVLIALGITELAAIVGLVAVGGILYRVIRCLAATR